MQSGKIQFLYIHGCCFPQSYTHPVENTNSTIRTTPFYFPHILRILTGSFSRTSPVFPQIAFCSGCPKSACAEPDFSKQLFIPQKHSFLRRLHIKNRGISRKNRHSTFSQLPTTAPTAIIPYSYLILCVRCREQCADRGPWC